MIPIEERAKLIVDTLRDGVGIAATKPVEFVRGQLEAAIAQAQGQMKGAEAMRNPPRVDGVWHAVPERT